MRKGRYGVSEKTLRTMDGIVFDSKAEMERYADLKLLVRAKVITELTLQPAFDVFINGEKYCTYTADFSYLDEDGDRIVEDVKSSATFKDPAFRLRKKAAELYHQIEIFSVDSEGEVFGRRRKRG